LALHRGVTFYSLGDSLTLCASAQRGMTGFERGCLELGDPLTSSLSFLGGMTETLKQFYVAPNLKYMSSLFGEAFLAKIKRSP
jgi:hypothetical protein